VAVGAEPHHPEQVTVFLAVSPITAAGLGAALLGERLSMGLFVGLACVALGLWLAYRPDIPSGADESAAGQNRSVGTGGEHRTDA